jgi:hypothetical protein
MINSTFGFRAPPFTFRAVETRASGSAAAAGRIFNNVRRSIFFIRLPNEPARDLNKPRSIGRGDHPKVYVTHRGVRIIKLGVIKSIEKFASQFETRRFGKAKSFLESDIEIVCSRAE